VVTTFENPRIDELAAAFAPTPAHFKGQVLLVKPQQALRVLVLRDEQGSIQLGGFLFVQVKGQLDALVKIVTLRFEEDGIWVGVRPVCSRAVEANWAQAAPKLKGATVLGLTAPQHELVERELAGWNAQAEQFSQATRADEERARLVSLEQARQTWALLLHLAPADACVTHFNYLLDSPRHEALLRRIAAYATGLRALPEELDFDFGAQETLTCTPPTLKSYAGWPSSFQRLVAVHEHLSFPREGWALVLGESGAITQRAALIDYSDYWVYEGEQLRLLSHEVGLSRRTDLPAGELFLTRMLEHLDDR
jgi:hypothetical protein